jgi:hypothetical protein
MISIAETEKKGKEEKFQFNYFKKRKQAKPDK